jgi:FAD/FMN-containing dehydrogenase
MTTLPVPGARPTVAGFVQGGGFGSLSKQFGTGAASLLEAEIVTADGTIRIINQVQEPDLFMAIKGGGGGTFGVVTRMTMRTHELPRTIGAVNFEVQASSDAAWQALVAHMIDFYAEALFNPTWGEIIRFAPGRTLSVLMMFHGLDEAQARSIWQPFLAWMATRPSDIELKGRPRFIAVPGNRFWDPSFLRDVPGAVIADDRPGAPASNVFWAANLGEAGQVLNGYQSAWLPQSLLSAERRAALVEALVAGSSQWPVALHVNKGMAGGTLAALSLTEATSTNPAVLDAFALLICAADAAPAWPGISGFEPDVATGRNEAAAVRRAMAPFMALVPEAGAYMSEGDYFDDKWRSRYWGAHYLQLQTTKRKYDPASVFHGHQTVSAS